MAYAVPPGPYNGQGDGAAGDERGSVLASGKSGRKARRSANPENQAQDPHPDGHGGAEESHHGCDGPAEVSAYVGAQVPELQDELVKAAIHIVEATADVRTQVIQPLMHIVDAL